MGICEGFPLPLEGVSGGFPKVSEGFLQIVTARASKHNNKYNDVNAWKSFALQSECTISKTAHTTERTNQQGFPNVPADPFYIIKRGTSMGTAARMRFGRF